MPNNLTDNEIKKALECMLGIRNNDIECQIDCLGCAFDNDGLCHENCSEGIAKATLDLINRKEQKYKELWEERNRIYESFKETSEELEEYRKAYVNQQAENESLKTEIERLGKELETEKNQVIRLENQIGRLLSMNQAKLDTIHDLQEENNWYNETLNTTKAEAYNKFAYLLKRIPRASVFKNEIDNLLNELVGGNNE